jgi:phosphate transport system substrate-binding protein
MRDNIIKGNFMKAKIFLLFFTFIGIMVFSQNNNEPIVIDDAVRLVEYYPGSTGISKVALLEEESKLKFFTNLPILDGATALYPVYASFVTAVYPKRYYYPYNNDSIVKCSTTSLAYDNLLEGKVDLIFCTEPSRQHLEKAKELGVEFNLTPIGRDAFVFFVNKNNPIENITSLQIRDIYSGEITNWNEINGINETIIAYQRPENSGSQTALQIIMEKRQIMEPIKETLAGGMGEIIDRVSSYINYKNAIGYSFLFFTTEMVKNQEIKLLGIDGIFPSKETIQNNTYPFSGLFYAITLGNETENVRKFIDWILSAQGQYLIEKTGYVPW